MQKLEHDLFWNIWNNDENWPNITMNIYLPVKAGSDAIQKQSTIFSNVGDAVHCTHFMSSKHWVHKFFFGEFPHVYNNWLLFWNLHTFSCSNVIKLF